MARGNRKLDQFLSVIVILLYVVIVVIKWILAYNIDIDPNAIKAVGYIGTAIQCLMLIIVCYNACGWTDSFIIKIVFIALTLFLITTAVVQYIPVVADWFNANHIPYGFLV